MKEAKNACDLQRCYLCKHCMREWLPAIAASRTTYIVNKGTTIFNEGEKMKGMYFVYEGSIKVHKKWDDEKELIIRFAKSGDILGHRGLGIDSLYPVTATALEPSVVCCVPISFFQASLKVNEALIHQLLMFFADELKASERNMRNLAHMPVRGRLLNALVQLHTKFGVDDQGAINLNISRQDLASVTGSTYETTFRILSELISDGLIQYTEKRISIIDINKLLQLVSETTSRKV